ncbi:MAG TPA: type II toxin-antitoxin system HipA family toxin, partial [Rhodanobacteraceae bacterium]|nr:type II toxin-antitoxin system HipA family toxin [Rhodanobacteraceae bacterium]
MTTSAAAPEHVDVATPQGASGTLQHARDYLFTYAAGASPHAEISLTMPARAAQYVSAELHPIFQMNLPEGYVLDRLRARFAKASTLNPMLLLALTGRGAAIGRVTVSTPAVTPVEDTRGERLDEILAWDGAEDLFAELADRYLLRTGASGVQPKLLVPETTRSKSSMLTRELIVKSAGDDYPGLAVNEYVCMSIAREAGMPVPEFHLSKNRQLFVMRRFDRTADGAALGFEDMAVLMGQPASAKYDSSYERIAKAIALYCSPEERIAALAQLFDQVVLSCIVGNGDAHLKNFGVVYDDPHRGAVRLAPAYDIVSTTAYIPEDGLALLLGGSKSLFAARANLG